MASQPSRAASLLPLHPLPCQGCFFLKSHIFLCRAKRHWVILDVNRDKYLCVDRAQFESLGSWIDGWQETQAGPERAAIPPSSASALANNLLSLGILSEQAPGAGRQGPRRMPIRQAPWIWKWRPAHASPRCTHAPSFFFLAAPTLPGNCVGSALNRSLLPFRPAKPPSQARLVRSTKGKRLF